MDSFAAAEAENNDGIEMSVGGEQAFRLELCCSGSFAGYQIGGGVSLRSVDIEIEKQYPKG